MGILVVRLKAIKYKEDFFYYLSFYLLDLSPQAAYFSDFFYPWQKHNLPKPRILESVPTIWTGPCSLSPLLATWCPSPQVAPERPTFSAIALRQPGQFIHQGAILIAFNKPYSHHPHGGSIDLELCVDWGRFLATPQTTDLAGNRSMNVSSARSCKAIRGDPNSNRIESRKVASQQMGCWWVDVETVVEWRKERFPTNRITVSGLLNNAI